MKFPAVFTPSAEAFEALGMAPAAVGTGISQRFKASIDEWLESNEREFKAEAKGDTLEITIMDVIGEGWWYSGVTAQGVKRALDAARNAKTVKVLMNSPGGDVFEGLAIQALLKRHAAKVEIEVLGWAASAASVISMSGDTIAMHEGSFMMIHECWTIAMGRASDMRSTADMMDKVNSSIIDLYERRTGGSRDEIAKMVSDETWLTAEESRAKGFADEVIPGKAPAKKEKAEAKPAAKTESDPSPRIAAPRASATDSPRSSEASRFFARG